MGLHLVKQVLKKFTNENEPLKLIIDHDFFKIGFTLKRSDLEESHKIYNIQ